MSFPGAWASLLLLTLMPTLLPAQGGRATAVSALTAAETGAYQEATRLEGGGNPAKALDILQPLLEKHPAEFRLLYLMDLCLTRLDKRRDMLPLISQALRVDSSSIGVLGMAVRTFGSMQMPDSAQRYAERWASLVPGSPVPFRDWSEAAGDARDRAGALLALQVGRKSLGSPTALAPDIAQAHQYLGDYSAAAAEWIAALTVTSSFRNGAVMLLGQTPPAKRPDVTKALQSSSVPASRQLLSVLLIRWGQAASGADLLRTALPADTAEALSLLGDALDALRSETNPSDLLAKAGIHEAIAARQIGSSAVRNRLEAARAYADAGADREARRVLATISSDPNVSANMASSAAATLLGVLIAEGKANEAETALEQIRSKLNVDDYEAQRRRIALLFARGGNAAHAEALIRDDSTVAGIDLLGRVRLFQGDLRGAADALRYAGPFDDARPQAVSRITILAFLQAVNQDSSARLGAAFLALEVADSAEALRLFDSLAATLSPAGSAEAKLKVGQLALGLADSVRASAAFVAADVITFPGTAAMARLERARLLAASGKRSEAKALVERLILDFPDSALVPDARRLRDELRNSIPSGGS